MIINYITDIIYNIIYRLVKLYATNRHYKFKKIELQPTIILHNLEIFKVPYYIPTYSFINSLFPILDTIVYAYLNYNYKNGEYFTNYDDYINYINEETSSIESKRTDVDYLKSTVYKNNVQTNENKFLSDVDFSLFCTRDLCSHLLQKVVYSSEEDVNLDKFFKIDISIMENFDVKPDYEKYGGILYFNESRQITQIDYLNNSYFPTTTLLSWNKIKYIVTSSLMTFITVINHMWHSHLFVGNFALLAIYDCLDYKCDLFNLLSPFSFRTIDTNTESRLSLISRGGFAEHLFAYKYETVQSLLTSLTKLSHFNTSFCPIYLSESEELYENKYFEECSPEFYINRCNMQEYKTDPNFGFLHDGLLYWDIIKDYVGNYLEIMNINVNHDDIVKLKNYIKLYYNKRINFASQTSLINFFTNIIFNNTGYHEHVGGNITDYLKKYNYFPFLTRKSDSLDDPLLFSPTKSVLKNTFLLTYFTTMRMPPLLSDYSYLFKDNNKLLENYNRFVKNLYDLTTKINILNKSRIPYNAFDPSILEISISV
jgi:hypothetical protein